MAFHDALFDDDVTVDGIAAGRADTGLEIRTSLAHASGVTITELGLLDLIVVQAIDILVDARMQKYLATPDLRRLGRLAIGSVPALPAAPIATSRSKRGRARPGRIVREGCTDQPDGVSRRLGSHAGERFVRAELRRPVEYRDRDRHAGVQGFRRRSSRKRAGARAIRRDICAAIVRDGTEVPAGAKLLEIDSRGPQSELDRYRRSRTADRERGGRGDFASQAGRCANGRDLAPSGEMKVAQSAHHRRATHGRVVQRSRHHQFRRTARRDRRAAAAGRRSLSS